MPFLIILIKYTYQNGRLASTAIKIIPTSWWSLTTTCVAWAYKEIIVTPTSFNTFDIDRSGTISADELKAVLGKHHAYDDDMWVNIINEVDQNGDGVIDLREFSEMMLKMT